MRYYDDSNANKLASLMGETIQGIYLCRGEDLLVIEIGDDPGNKAAFRRFAWRAVGDCCSDSWFADITGVEALLGGTVTNIMEHLTRSVDDGRTRQEHDLLYGITITTEEGRGDIIFRNSSNGYYGGWLESCEAPTSLKGYRKITEDWSA